MVHLSDKAPAKHGLASGVSGQPPLAPQKGPSAPEVDLWALLDHGLAGLGHLSQAGVNGLKHLSKTALFRPTVERQVHQKITQDVLRDRMVPLLSHMLEREISQRGDVANTLAPQLKVLLEEAKEIQASDAAQLQSRAADLGNRLTKLLDDVDYVTVGTVGVVAKVRAANAVLQTSKLLWTSIRTGFALRDPVLRRQGMSLMASSHALLGKADMGLDVQADLQKLEDDTASFTTALAEKVPDSPLQEAPDAFAVAQGIWRLRERSARIFDEIEGCSGPRSSRQLIEAFETHGVPEQLVREVVDEELEPLLNQLLDRVRDQRGDDADALRAAVDLTRDHADALAQQIKVDPRALNDVESKTAALSQSIDELLTLAERVVRPLDGPVKRLHKLQRSLGALQGLFVTVRAVELSQDSEFLDRARALQPRLEAVLQGKVAKHQAAAALMHIDADLRELHAEMQEKLHVDQLPLAKQIFEGMDLAVRMAKVRLAADMAVHPVMEEGLRAAGDLDMSKEERGAKYDAALGAPLVETVVGLSIASRELGLDLKFGELGGKLDELLRGGESGKVNPLLARSPLAFLAEAEFQGVFERVEQFFAEVDTPAAKERIDKALDLFRAVYEVERDLVSDIAMVIPEGQRVRVGAALTEYTSKSTVTLLSWLSEQLAEPSGDAMAEFLDLMVDDSARGIDALSEDKDASPQDLKTFSTAMRHYARDRAGTVALAQFQLLGSHVDDTVGGKHADKLREYSKELQEVLSVVETTDASREALDLVLSDLRSSVRMAVNLTHLFGAVSNPNMEAADRQRVVQQSVERMGPLFIKMMQTLVNLQPLLKRMYPEADLSSDDVLVESLRQLQDNVTPIAWPLIQDRIRDSLDLPEGIPLVDTPDAQGHFVSLEQQPIKSGSIGQLHRAKVRVERGGKTVVEDVMVKVLRPGIEEAFEDTIRVTRLTLNVFSQLLKLDEDGNIFGPMKAEAERRLPLIEKALYGFIESFRVETKFFYERDNLKAFGAIHGADNNVVVPEVYDAYTKGDVLTMQELKGHKLSDWIDWHRDAKAAVRLIEDQGALPSNDHEAIKQRATAWLAQTKGEVADTVRVRRQRGRYVWLQLASKTGSSVELRFDARTGRINAHGVNPSRQAAERKARIWAERAYGRKVADARSYVLKDDVVVELTLTDDRNTQVKLTIDSDTGQINPERRPPDLSKKGIEQLRSRLIQACVTQVARMHLHADPHEGNFFVMPDGETIGLFDFGLALELNHKDAGGPLNLLAGALMKDSEQLARGMMAVSVTPSDTSQNELRLAELSTFFTDLLKQAEDTHPAKGGFGSRLKARWQQAKLVLSRSLEAVSRCNIVPQPRFLHALKATLSMVGNMAQFEGLELTPTSKAKTFMLFAKAGLKAAIAPLIGRRRRRLKKKRLNQMMTPPQLEASAQAAVGPVAAAGHTTT